MKPPNPSAPLVRRLLALALIVMLLPLPRLGAQASAVQSPAPLMLHITILDGEEALNNIRQRTAREPIVQVEDENHKPVAGALVLFAITPSSGGAGGTFATPFGASTTFKTVTDANGRAVGRGLQPNATAGQFTITITASVGAVVAAAAVIHMANSLFGGASTGESSSTNAASNSTSSTNSSSPSSSSSTGNTTASTSGGGTTTTSTAGGGIFHVFHVLPNWAIVTVGVVAGAATAVAIVTLTGSSGANITPGSGSVTGH